MLDSHDIFQRLEQAAESIRQADGLLITAGAGMGVDSGLPDFRGHEGLWEAYPALRKAHIQFQDIASPETFIENPQLAWGFYGHRLNLYRQALPHEGFNLIKQMGEEKPHGYFVFTSNVDGQFQKAGYPPTQIAECHGSIHHLQCIHGCMNEIWSADDLAITTDDSRCLITSPLPRCPHCGDVARPNIALFGDNAWLPERYLAQKSHFIRWLSPISRLTILEIGAGTALPTIRNMGEQLTGTLIRINPRQPHTSKADSLSLPFGALSALTGITELYWKDRCP